MTKVHRNELCSCGSGKKYKKCCALKEAIQKQQKPKKQYTKTASSPAAQGLSKIAGQVLQMVFNKPLSDSSSIQETEAAENPNGVSSHRTLEQMIGIDERKSENT